MMATMIERVARAIYAAMAAPSEPYWGCLDEGTKHGAKSIARAAIAAMREPTETMVAAGLRLDPDGYVKGNWYFMIDAALKEE